MQRLEQEGPLQSLPGEIEYWHSVWRNVHRELPSGLFHYTDAAGLQGIVKSGRLWATHIYYLNDTQEFNTRRESLTICSNAGSTRALELSLKDSSNCTTPTRRTFQYGIRWQTPTSCVSVLRETCLANGERTRRMERVSQSSLNQKV